MHNKFPQTLCAILSFPMPYSIAHFTQLAGWDISKVCEKILCTFASTFYSSSKAFELNFVNECYVTAYEHPNLILFGVYDMRNKLQIRVYITEYDPSIQSKS